MNYCSKTPIKAGIWYTCSNILLRGISVISAPIFTRLLSTYDYGVYNNVFSWQNILMVFFGLCLNYSIGRAKIDYSHAFNSYLSSIQFLSLFSGIFVFIAIIPFMEEVACFMEIDESLLVSLLVVLIFSPSIDFYQSKLRFEYKYHQSVVIAVISTIGTVVLSILFIYLSDDGKKYLGRIYGSFLPIILIGLYCFYTILKSGKTIININYWSYALKYSLPMIPHGLGMIILAQIDRIMIVKSGDVEGNGIYCFGYSFGILLSVITNAIINAWQPWVYDNLNSGNYLQINRSNQFINGISCLFTLILVSITPEIIFLLGSEPFRVSIWIIMPIILGTLFQYLYSTFTLLELYEKKTIFVPIGTLLAALFNIALNYILIPIYGYQAAAYTTMVSYFVLLIFHWMIYKMIFKYSVYEEKSLLKMILVTILLCFLFQSMYTEYFVRYFSILFIIVIIYFKYQNIIKISNIKKYVKQ